jgi:hypothetical protein
MKKILGIDEWVLTKKISADKRRVEVSIYLKYPDIKSLLKIQPKDRLKTIDQDQKIKFDRLLATKLFDKYTKLGTVKRPSGIKTKVSYSLLKKINSLNYIQHAYVTKIEQAKKVNKPKPLSFFCVKMTVAVEVEGRKKGNQTIEERYVLVKANSFDDAYKRVEKQKKSYSELYLNPNGQFVRWRIESLDDCFSTDINSITDLNKPEGIEVFSVLKTRKLTAKHSWDGKIMPSR